MKLPYSNRVSVRMCAAIYAVNEKHSATESTHHHYLAYFCSKFLPCWPNRLRRACSSRKWESSSWRISHRAKPTSRIAATVGTTSDQRVALNSSCSLSWERPPQVRHWNTIWCRITQTSHKAQLNIRINTSAV